MKLVCHRKPQFPGCTRSDRFRWTGEGKLRLEGEAVPNRYFSIIGTVENGQISQGMRAEHVVHMDTCVGLV